MPDVKTLTVNGTTYDLRDSNSVTDVTVNGTSVVSSGTAAITDASGNLTLNGQLDIGNQIVLPNNKGYRAKLYNSNTSISLISLSTSDNVVVGNYSSYSSTDTNNTNIYGKVVGLYAKDYVYTPSPFEMVTGNALRFNGSSSTVKAFAGAVTGDQDRLYLGGGRVMFRNYTDASTYTTMAQITTNGIISSTHATGSDSAVIGYTTYTESSTSQSLTTDTAKTLASTTLAAGQWIVVGTARFTGGASSGNNGVKALGILTGTSTLGTSTPGHMRVYATANWTQALSTTRILSLTASTTVTLQGLSTQDTPGSVAYCTMRWIRIA